MIQQIIISDTSVPVIEDIAEKEKLTFTQAVQLIWDNNAMQNVHAHEKDMTDRLIRGLSSADKKRLLIEKKL